MKPSLQVLALLRGGFLNNKSQGTICFEHLNFMSTFTRSVNTISISYRSFIGSIDSSPKANLYYYQKLRATVRNESNSGAVCGRQRSRRSRTRFIILSLRREKVRKLCARCSYIENESVDLGKSWNR